MKITDLLISLKDDLESNTSGRRGNAIAKLKEILKVSQGKDEHHEVLNFFIEINRDFSNIFGAFEEYLEPTIKQIIENPQKVRDLLDVLEILESDLGKKLEELNYKLGLVSEKLSKYYNPISKTIMLRKARYYYRKSNDQKNEKRIQDLLSSMTKHVSQNVLKPIPVPKIYEEKIKNIVTIFIDGWKHQTLNEKIDDLINGIPYSLPKVEPNTINNLWDVMEKKGVITTQMISNDGRVSGNKIPSPTLRSEFYSWQFSFLYSCSLLKQALFDWLGENEDEIIVFEKIANIFIHKLDWDDNLSNTFNDGFAAFLDEKYSYCLSLWIPFFEHALRLSLIEKGESVLKEKEKIGIEDYVLLKGLLEKAKYHYPKEVIKYWRFVLSTSDGMGWNLRNDFTHGLLQYNQFSYEYSFSVLLSYFFLLSSSESRSDIIIK